MANYSFIRSLPTVENGHTFEGDNFTQLYPHTSILSGITGLTFRNCNLTNCDIPVDATIVRSMRVHISFCSHLNPIFMRHGLLECSENCSHVVGTDTVQVDGVTVSTIYHYKNTVVT